MIDKRFIQHLNDDTCYDDHHRAVEIHEHNQCVHFFQQNKLLQDCNVLSTYRQTVNPVNGDNDIHIHRYSSR